MTAEDKAVMEMVVKRVKSVMPVNKVILFGSRARGDTHEDSDFDICVIVDALDESEIKYMQKIRRSLIGHMLYPMDVLVYSKDNFDYRSKHRSFEKAIAEEGVSVYG